MMKRLMLMALVMMIAMGADAKKNGTLDITSGDAGVLKQNTKTITVIFDYDNTEIEGMSKADYFQKRAEKDADYAKDFDEQSEESRGWFIDRWNSEKQMIRMQENGPTDYTMKVKITSYDLGNSLAAHFGTLFNAKAGGIIMSGIIEVMDNATGQVVCTMEMDELKMRSVRGADLKFTSEGRRRCLGMRNLAKDIIDLVK